MVIFNMISTSRVVVNREGQLLVYNNGVSFRKVIKFPILIQDGRLSTNI